MTIERDEVVEMARQVGIIFHGLGNTPEELESFAKLVAAKEREMFKAVCEKSRYAKQDEWRVTRSMVVTEIIEAIDARGEA